MTTTSLRNGRIAHRDGDSKFHYVYPGQLATVKDALYVPRFDDGGYQRALNEKKARGVHKTLDEGKPIVGEIILAYTGDSADFDSKAKRLDLDLGEGTLAIIDGQHRCEGALRFHEGSNADVDPRGPFLYLVKKTKDMSKEEHERAATRKPNKVVPMSFRILVGYSEEECAEWFRLTNGTMTKVSAGDLWAAKRHRWSDAEAEHQALFEMWSEPDGPLDGIAKVDGSAGITPHHWRKFAMDIMRDTRMGDGRESIEASFAAFLIGAHGAMATDCRSVGIFRALCAVAPEVVGARIAKGHKPGTITAFVQQKLTDVSRESIRESLGSVTFETAKAALRGALV